ncbi:MAG: hypothetical protein KGZ63_06645 [Clostridiales bacterium]|nr:hypothetical protein [Clostridiales bacterium]
MKNLGVNYGLVFTAWGAGGVFGPLLGGMVRDVTGTYGVAFAVSAVLSTLGIIITMIIKAPDKALAAKKVHLPAGLLNCPHCGEGISLQASTQKH